MYSIILVIHVIIAVFLIGMVLVQKPEGGALGSLGGGDNMGFLSGRATGNFLTKTTSILAVLFIITSLTLAYIAKGTSGSSGIVEERPAVTEASGRDADTGTGGTGTGTGAAGAAPQAPLSRE